MNRTLTPALSVAEKVLALHAVTPFDALSPEELLIVAAAAEPAEFAPGRVLCHAGGTLNRLYVRVDGDVVDDAGTVMQPVIGTTLLMTGITAPFRMLAGPQGYRALAISRGKFFTLVNQCPALLIGFFRMPLLGVDYAAPTTR